MPKPRCKRGHPIQLPVIPNRIILAAHFDELTRWRISSESHGLGRGGAITTWAREHFPEIPELEAEIRRLGHDLKPRTHRW